MSKVFCSKADQEEIGKSLKIYEEHYMCERRKKNRDAMQKKLKKQSEEAGRGCNKAETFLNCC